MSNVELKHTSFVRDIVQRHGEHDRYVIELIALADILRRPRRATGGLT